MDTLWTVSHSVGKDAEDIGRSRCESVHYVCQSCIAHNIDHHFTALTAGFLHGDLKATDDSIS